MRWRGRARPDIELRVRRGGRWSRWEHLHSEAEHNPDPRRGEHHASGSEPIWVGRAGAVQYKLSRRLPGLRLHFVDVGVRPAKLRARAAQTTPPPYVTRAQWGASGCPPRSSPDYGEVRSVHVHHTVSLNDYTPAEAPRHRARHLPLPPQLERLERHRLQRARRQVRDALRGPRGGPRQGGRRGSGAGLQLGHRRNLEHRRPHQPAPDTRGALRDGELHPLEAHHPRAAARRRGHGYERGRLREPLRRGRAGDARARDRAPRHGAHRLSGSGAVRAAARAARARRDRRRCALPVVRHPAHGRPHRRQPRLRAARARLRRASRPERPAARGRAARAAGRERRLVADGPAHDHRARRRLLQRAQARAAHVRPRALSGPGTDCGGRLRRGCCCICGR